MWWTWQWPKRKTRYGTCPECDPYGLGHYYLRKVGSAPPDNLYCDRCKKHYSSGKRKGKESATIEPKKSTPGGTHHTPRGSGPHHQNTHPGGSLPQKLFGVREFAEMDATLARLKGEVEFPIDLTYEAREFKHRVIRKALKQTGDNITHTAKLLGMTRTALSQYINTYGLK